MQFHRPARARRLVLGTERLRRFRLRVGAPLLRSTGVCITVPSIKKSELKFVPIDSPNSPDLSHMCANVWFTNMGFPIADSIDSITRKPLPILIETGVSANSTFSPASSRPLERSFFESPQRNMPTSQVSLLHHWQQDIRAHSERVDLTPCSQ